MAAACSSDRRASSYLTTGDEGDDGNPYNQGQRINGGLFGGVLRIDVDRDSSRSHPIRRQPLSGVTPPRLASELHAELLHSQ